MIHRVLVGLAIGMAALIVAFLAVVIHHEIVEPKEGRVTQTEYVPATTTMTCSGKPIVCTSTHYPECYRVVYRPNAEEWGDDCASPREFETIKIGDWYTQ